MLGPGFRELLPFSQKNISEDRPSSQSMFQFIPKMLNRVKVRVLCRPVEFFNNKL